VHLAHRLGVDPCSLISSLQTDQRRYTHAHDDTKSGDRTSPS
jgi:hypothetical protein